MGVRASSEATGHLCGQEVGPRGPGLALRAPPGLSGTPAPLPVGRQLLARSPGPQRACVPVPCNPEVGPTWDGGIRGGLVRAWREGQHPQEPTPLLPGCWVQGEQPPPTPELEAWRGRRGRAGRRGANGVGSVPGPQGSTSLDPGGLGRGLGPGEPAGRASGRTSRPLAWAGGAVGGWAGESRVLGGTEVRWACVEPGNWKEGRFTQGDKYIKR